MKYIIKFIYKLHTNLKENNHYTYCMARSLILNFRVKVNGTTVCMTFSFFSKHFSPFDDDKSNHFKPNYKYSGRESVNPICQRGCGPPVIQELTPPESPVSLISSPFYRLPIKVPQRKTAPACMCKCIVSMDSGNTTIARGCFFSSFCFTRSPAS